MLKKLFQMIAPKAPKPEMSPEEKKRFKKLFENAAKGPSYGDYRDVYGW